MYVGAGKLDVLKHDRSVQQVRKLFGGAKQSIRGIPTSINHSLKLPDNDGEKLRTSLDNYYYLRKNTKILGVNEKNKPLGGFNDNRFLSFKAAQNDFMNKRNNLKDNYLNNPKNIKPPNSMKKQIEFSDKNNNEQVYMNILRERHNNNSMANESENLQKYIQNRIYTIDRREPYSIKVSDEHIRPAIEI